MTTYTGNTSGLFLQDGDFIAPGAIVGVLNGFYVVQIDNDAVVRIAGTVWGDLAVLANPGVTLTVAPTGSLSARDRAGLEIDSGGTLNNYGSIDGGNFGVVMGGGASNVITNVGLISGDNYGLYVFAGSSYTSMNFNNLGGTVIAETAIAGAGDLTTINNTGLIASSNGTAGTAVTPAGSKLVLTNSGTIVGKVFGGVQNDVVVNNGQMQGDVDLGAGNDTYRGVGWVDGTVLGNDGNDTLTGGIYDDRLDGGADNDILDGGRGADTMTGGLGNDTFYVDTSGDRVIEAVGGGTDTVYTSVSYTLRAGQEIENLAVNPDTDYANLAINLTGNEFANTLTGNDATNRLDGKGGADTMIGGDGNDIYYVDDAGDVVVETANQGTDTVYTSVSHALSANIETLRAQGTADLSLTGNSLDNLIVGNDGANRIDGGAGGDQMIGGAGNDTYVVDNIRDTVVEKLNGGIDTVESSVSFTLAAYVETLTLTGSAAIDGTGNKFANAITGNGAANTINGKGGFDTLTGGGGADTFVFASKLDAGVNYATITDFQHGVDHIALDLNVFRKSGAAGTLEDQFFTASAPTTKDQHIIYDATTGVLSFDIDGVGTKAAPIAFAQVHARHHARSPRLPDRVRSSLLLLQRGRCRRLTSTEGSGRNTRRPGIAEGPHFRSPVNPPRRSCPRLPAHPSESLRLPRRGLFRAI